MNYFFGVLALLGVGTINLLIEQHKQDKSRISQLEKRLTPWNKGKTGYKQPRKRDKQVAE